MKWRQINWGQGKKRDADLARELRSDLELEEEEQREGGVLGKRLATRPCVLLAILLLFVNRLLPSGPGTGWNPSHAIFALACERFVARPALPLSPSW